MLVLLCLHLYCTVYLQQIRRYLHDERVTHATHFDLQALVTVVVSLSSSGVDFEGGLFVSTGSVGEDSDSDMYVPLQAGDAVHDCTRLFDMPYILVMIFYLRFNFYFPLYLSHACVHLCISYCCLLSGDSPIQFVARCERTKRYFIVCCPESSVEADTVRHVRQEIAGAG